MRRFALMILAVPTACSSAAVSLRPRLNAIVPDAVALREGNVTEVELVGSGFDTTLVSPDNIVRIGPLTFTNVPSRERGTRIRVAIPAMRPSGSEAPPGPWGDGRYQVSVSTRMGTSDTLPLSIGTSRTPR